MQQAVPTDDRVIMGIDPGTNLMGYAFIGVNGNKARLIAMGVIDLRKCHDSYIKLGEIFTRVQGLIQSFLPDELAIEAPFFGKNVQSMLKLGRAQGVAIAAAISREVPIHEYAPLKIKMAITGNGSASKQQVAEMLRRMLNISADEMPRFMDATDALGAAFCHFLQRNNPVRSAKYSSWADFVRKNNDKVKG
ncbi:MAG: crossover junction endodeoxyribonuclease RuvC [Bacteroidaceae bacterium]|nr:crossover junction endodeoxyribonuclease RuvC [Bacteroidales bacterium]MBO5263588.1 crossover junction endodeoxyribonuclease RuvC [Bacteroidaceae bacterium]MBQ8257721.1 crossover junction endodeoxyribonuclease RuvC [Bacteroidaceae bacterium]